MRLLQVRESRRRWMRVFLACHLGLAFAVSLREAWWVGRLQLLKSHTFFESLSSSSASRLVVTYLHLSGIESGYGYFAPNVPPSYELRFEVTLPDGTIDRVYPTFARREEKLRWATLLDYLGQTASPEVREVLLKLMTFAISQQYPTAAEIRAVVTKMVLPHAVGYTQGERARHEFAFSYDFAVSDRSEVPAPENL